MIASHREKAMEAYGAAAPDWVLEAAKAADRRGLADVGRAIGYSPAVVSQIIGNKYPGDVGRVAEKVRGALMGATVTCPGLGEIARDSCIDWQAKPWAPTSAHRVRMYRLCRSGCPHFRIKGGDDAD